MFLFVLKNAVIFTYICTVINIKKYLDNIFSKINNLIKKHRIYRIYFEKKCWCCITIFVYMYIYKYIKQFYILTDLILNS